MKSLPKQTVVGVTTILGVPGSPELLLFTFITSDRMLQAPIAAVTFTWRSPLYALISRLFEVELPSAAKLEPLSVLTSQLNAVPVAGLAVTKNSTPVQ